MRVCHMRKGGGKIRFGIYACSLKEKEQVKLWYDGFIFGEHKDIYNPWSILNFLDTGKYAAY